MPGSQGFAQLRSTQDLLSKLKSDRARMEGDPNDVYPAFDFFVTAEHLVDWYYPDTQDQKRRRDRTDLRNSEPLLQIVSHIANGAKHFEATAAHHQSVEDVKSNTGGFSPNSFSPSAFSPGSFQFSGLTVELDDGSSRHVFEIADEVISYWERVLGT